MNSSSGPSGHPQNGGYLQNIKTEIESPTPQPNSSPSPRHHFQDGVLLENGEVFSVDAMQLCDDDNVYNLQDFEANGMTFSCEALRAAMASSDSASVVTEVDNAANWQVSANGFIPVGPSDLRQLQASGGSGNASANGNDEQQTIFLSGTTNGSFYHQLALNHSAGTTKAGSFSSEGSSSTVNSAFLNHGSTSIDEGSLGGDSSISTTSTTGGDCQTDPLGSPPNNVKMATPAQDPASLSHTPLAGAQVKVRKPRGRKPKHVKEQEALAAAAAAAAAAEKGGNVPAPPQKRFNLRDKSNSKTRNERSHDAPSQMQQHEETPETAPPSPFVTYRGNGRATNNVEPSSPLNKFPNQQLGHPNQGQVSLDQLACQDRQALMTQTSADRQTQQQQPPNNNYQHQGYQYLQGRERTPPRSCTPPVPARPTSAHAHYPKSPYNSEARLDRLFSSRIAAPSNKTVVKPKIIQENRTMYNLLTRPTAPRPGATGFEKLSQERWMQFPNPSILPDGNSGNGRNASNNEHSSSGYYAQGTYPPPSHTSAGQTSRYILGQLGHRNCLVNIRRNSGESQQQAGGSGEQSGVSQGASFPSNPPPAYSYHVINQNSSQPRSSVSQCGHKQRHVQDLQNEIFEEKVRYHHLAKMHKSLMARMRSVCEQNEELKARLAQAEILMSDRPSSLFTGWGLGFSHMPASPFMDDGFPMRGNDLFGRMPGGRNGRDRFSGDNDEFSRFRLRNRSASYAGERRPLFSDVDEESPILRRGEGAFKRPMGDLASQMGQDNRKKPCSSSVISGGGMSEETRSAAVASNGEGTSVAGEVNGRATGEKNSSGSTSTGDGGGGRGSAFQVSSNAVNLPSLKMEVVGHEVGGGGSGPPEISPGAATDIIIMNDEGENTSSTSCPSPSSSGSQGSVGGIMTSAAAYHRNNFSVFGRMLVATNDKGTSPMKTNGNNDRSTTDPRDIDDTRSDNSSRVILNPTTGYLVAVSSTDPPPSTTSN